MTPLQDLIDRARLSSERMGASNPNRVLLREMAVALVAQARMVADMSQQLADKPWIIVP